MCQFLLCRVGSGLCALPLEHVVETMRPLPIVPVSGAPDFVCGLAIVRGTPVPVLHAARLLCTTETAPGRFVTMRVGNRVVALAVDTVLDVRSVPASSLHELPPLISNMPAAIISAVGILDIELLLVLRELRLLPAEQWTGLDALEASA